MSSESEFSKMEKEKLPESGLCPAAIIMMEEIYEIMFGNGPQPRSESRQSTETKVTKPPKVTKQDSIFGKFSLKADSQDECVSVGYWFAKHKAKETGNLSLLNEIPTLNNLKD